MRFQQLCETSKKICLAQCLGGSTCSVGCLVVEQQGQTPLSIAQRLGYISVVEVLKNITDVEAAPVQHDDKYNMMSPETMQETLMTDSEDEAGE